MKSSSVLPQTARVLAVILLTILFLPVAPMHGSQAAVELPRAASSPGQRSPAAAPEAAPAAWTRTLEPVVVNGSQLPGFSGAVLDDLFVFKFAGGTWTQVPFQFDEWGYNDVEEEETYFTFEDGLLDSNDELAFMAKDLGNKAYVYQWVDDASAKSYPRFELQVTNPLNPAEKGWVYVYRSATLTRAAGSYVAWDEVNTRFTGSSYVAAWTPDLHYGMDSLELNGSGVDVLDRAKLRVKGECRRAGEDPEPFDNTEEDEEMKDEYNLPTNVGPVRVGGGGESNRTWYYASLYQSDTQFDASTTVEDCQQLKFEVIRFSDDWLDPSASGMAPMTYYDNNTPAGVPVDGSPDYVPSIPLASWRLVSGARGTVVQVANVSAGMGSFTNVYKDDQTIDSTDFGDQKSYGEMGYEVKNSESIIDGSFSVFILGPHQGNVGAAYLQYHSNPPQTAATTQSYSCKPNGAGFGWLPRPVVVGTEVTFTAWVDPEPGPFTYAWTFGDGGTASGNPVTHTYTTAGAVSATLTVSNACGDAAPVVQQIKVWQEEPYLLYLPPVMRQ